MFGSQSDRVDRQFDRDAGRQAGRQRQIGSAWLVPCFELRGVLGSKMPEFPVLLKAFGGTLTD